MLTPEPSRSMRFFLGASLSGVSMTKQKDACKVLCAAKPLHHNVSRTQDVLVLSSGSVNEVRDLAHEHPQDEFAFA